MSSAQPQGTFLTASSDLATIPTLSPCDLGPLTLDEPLLLGTPGTDPGMGRGQGVTCDQQLSGRGCCVSLGEHGLPLGAKQGVAERRGRDRGRSQNIGSLPSSGELPAPEERQLKGLTLTVPARDSAECVCATQGHCVCMRVCVPGSQDVVGAREGASVLGRPRRLR